MLVKKIIKQKQDYVTKKPGILQVLPKLVSGGVEREVVDTAKAIAKEGYRSYVASAGGALVSQLTREGSYHLQLKLDSKNPLIIIYNIFKLKKIIEDNDIDIVHAQSRAPGWSAYFASKFTKCHFITTIHGAHGTKGFFKKLYNSVIVKGEKIIVVSKYIAEYAKEHYQFDHQKIELINCGTDLDNFNYDTLSKNRIMDLADKLKIPLDKSIIMLPGRLVRSKGHLFLLEAIKQLPKNSVICLFVGDISKQSSYIKELSNKIKEYGLEDTVMFTKNVLDMPAIYGLSDIVACVSTKPEAFGLVSIEAQAMGRLVIACNMGGIKETIIDQQTGWLIEPNNTKQLAETITKLLQIKNLERLRIARSARDNVQQNFSLASMCKKIIYVYNKILGI
ncbi:MAG: glycosyltransferase family 4 protein [Rickettsiales bacterium]